MKKIFILVTLFSVFFIQKNLATPMQIYIQIKGTVAGIPIGKNVSLFDTTNVTMPVINITNGYFTYTYKYPIASYYNFQTESYDGIKCSIINGSGGPLYNNVINVQVNCIDISKTFIAVTQNGEITISKDGINWINNQVNANISLKDALITNTNNFYVVGTSGSLFKDINSQSNWEKGDLSLTSTLNSIALYTDTRNNNQFVIVGDNATIQTSADSVYWNTQTSPSQADLIQTVYCNQRFYAIGNTANKTGVIMSSSDITANNWSTVYTSQPNEVFRSLFCSSSQLNGKTLYNLFVSGNNGLLLTSTDGFSWNQNTINTSYNINQIIEYKNSILIAIGESSNNTGAIFTSLDLGINWGEIISSTIKLNPFNSIAVDSDGLFVAVSANKIFTSNDLLIWNNTFIGDSVYNKVKTLNK